jgi:hypothetical protein
MRRHMQAALSAATGVVAMSVVASPGRSASASVGAPARMKTGGYEITVSAPNYLSAHGTLEVES